MLAGQDRLTGRLIADLRRLAQDDGIHVGFARQHRAEIGIVVHPFALRVAAGDGDQIDAVDLGDRGQMLVAGDLAQAYEAGLDAHSAFTLVLPSSAARVRPLRTGRVKGLASTSNTSPSWVAKPSEKDRVAVPKKWT